MYSFLTKTIKLESCLYEISLSLSLSLVIAMHSTDALNIGNRLILHMNPGFFVLKEPANPHPPFVKKKKKP